MTQFYSFSPALARYSYPKHDPGELEGFAIPMQRYRCNAVMSENGMVRAVLQPCHQAKLARGIEDEGARHVPETRLWREIPNLWRTDTRPLHIRRANLPIPASTIGGCDLATME